MLAVLDGPRLSSVRSTPHARDFIQPQDLARCATIVGTMAHTMMIEYGDDLLLGLGLSPAEFASEAKFLLAAKLYELGRLTSGQAAKLCGKGRVDFLLSLPRAGVHISNLQAEDADDDIAFAQHA